MILDQTPAPGIPIPNPDSCTVPELLELLAPKGAEMLINGIRNRVFVPPLKEIKPQLYEFDQIPAPETPVPNLDPCTIPSISEFFTSKGAKMPVNESRDREPVSPWEEVEPQSNRPRRKILTHAPKITPEDRHIDWQEFDWKWSEIKRRQRVLGPLWSLAIPAPNEPLSLEDPRHPFHHRQTWKRVIFDEIEEVPRDSIPGFHQLFTSGVPFFFSPTQGKDRDKALYVFSLDRKLLRLKKLKFEGEKFNDARIAAQKARVLYEMKEEDFEDHEHREKHRTVGVRLTTFYYGLR
jgi:methionyl-tRNA formyltransferase